MKTSSRILMGFGIAIAALVILTLVLVLTLGKSQSPLLPENSPQGVVQRYLLAVQEKNYPLAYTYLVPPDTTNIDKSQSYDNWLSSAQYSSNSTWKANLGQVDINGASANVTVTIDVFRAGGPFGNPVTSNSITLILQKSESVWLIASPTDLYWLY